MSVTTAGEQRRRAGAAPRRRDTAAAPGQRAAAPGMPGASRGRVSREMTRGDGPVMAGEPGMGSTHPGRPRAAAAPCRPGVPGGRRPGSGAGRERGPGVRQWPGAERRAAPILTLVPPHWSDTVEGQESAAPWQESAVPPRPPRGTGEVPRRVARGVPAGQARVRVRLTRRGRIVVAVFMMGAMVLVAVLAWLAGTARADAAGSGSPPAAVYHSLRAVVVRPGQSLWEIAAQAAPSADPRGVIQEIIDVNALSGMSVQPGQRLWVPRG